MNIKTLIGCILTALICTLTNYFIMNLVDGDGQGLLIYQFITVVFVGIVIGILFSLQKEDFDGKDNPVKKSKQPSFADLGGK